MKKITTSATINATTTRFFDCIVRDAVSFVKNADREFDGCQSVSLWLAFNSDGTWSFETTMNGGCCRPAGVPDDWTLVWTHIIGAPVYVNPSLIGDLLRHEGIFPAANQEPTACTVAPVPGKPEIVAPAEWFLD